MQDDLGYESMFFSWACPTAPLTAACTSGLARTLLNTRPSFIPFRSAAVPSLSPRNGAYPICRSRVASTSVARDSCSSCPSRCIVCVESRSPAVAGAAFLVRSGGVSCEMKMCSVMDIWRARVRIWKGRR